MSFSLAVIEPIIRQAGDIAMSYFKDLKNLTVNKKSSRDFVTAADVAVEAFLKQKLTAQYPEYGFWGEESGQTANQNRRWVVDPIDGTHSFAKGQYYWAISVALEINQELVAGVVYAPALDDYYCAQKGLGAWKNGEPIQVSDEDDLANSMVGTGFACIRSHLEDNNLARFCRIANQTTGQRRMGSAALDVCLVADGQLDLFWEQELNLYDVAGGAVVAWEAGATITDFQGKQGLFPKQVLVTNGKLLPQILPLM